MNEKEFEKDLRGDSVPVEYDASSSPQQGPDGEPGVSFASPGKCGETLEGAVAYVWGGVLLLRIRAHGWLVADDDVRFPTGTDSILVLWNGGCRTVPLFWPMRLPDVLEAVVLELIEKIRPYRLPPEYRRRRKRRTAVSPALAALLGDETFVVLP